MNRRRRLLALSAGASLLPGCASLTPPMTSSLLAEPAARQRTPVQLGVPFHPDDSTLCGPAALASVLQAAGVTTSPEALAPQVYLPAREGSLQLEMLTATARAGALPLRTPPTLAALLQSLDEGQPVLVLLNLALPIWPRWHYAVLVGHDLARGEVRLHSGTQAAAVWTLATFEHTWARAGHWAMVATPPARLPTWAEPTAAREAVLALERAKGPLAALPAWRGMATRWPDDLVLGMGLGNALYATKDLPAAERQFAAVAQRLDSAAAWNNLAQVRWERKRKGPAREAANQALRRAKAAEPAWLDAVQATRRQLGL